MCYRLLFNIAQKPLFPIIEWIAGSVLKSPFLRIRRYRGGIAVSIFIYCNPPNALRSKKAMLRKRDIPAMNVNCQYI